MMNLAVLTTAFPPFACAESDFVFQLCEGLSWRGVSVRAITSQAAPAPSARFPVTTRTGVGALAELLSYPLDGVLVPYQPWLFRGRTSLLHAVRALKWAKPNVARTLLIFNPDALVAANVSTLALFTRIVLLSERHASVVAQKFPDLKDRTAVVPPFSLVPGENLKSAEYGGDEPFRWLALGFLYPGKGIETLLKAFARLDPETSNARLTFVGGELPPGNQRWNSFGAWLKLLAESLGVANAVEWSGGYASPYEFPRGVVERSHAAVVPYDVGLGINNSGLATLTQVRLPVLSTRGPFLDSALKSGENCWLVRPKKPKELALAMRRFQTDAALREKLCQGSGELARRTFDRNALFDDWSRILRGDMVAALPADRYRIPRYN